MSGDPLDLSGYQVLGVDPHGFRPLINPRKQLNMEALLPSILDEEGKVMEPVHAWKPSADDPFRVLHNLGLDELVPIKGHRRIACCVEIVDHPGKYPKTVCDNASRVPTIILEGISEEKARNLALDDKDQVKLLSFEVFLEAFRRFEADHTYEQICEEMTAALYRVMLSKGLAKLTEMLRITEGAERIARKQKDLRNQLDQWVRSAHFLGPWFKDQVILEVKKSKDGINLTEEESKRRTFYANQENLRKLRSVYKNTKDDSWQRVTDVTVDPETYEIEMVGGNEAVKEALQVMVKEYRDPLAAKKDKPKLPNATERDEAKTQAVSEVGKKWAAFYCGLPSEGRTRIDERAKYWEDFETGLNNQAGKLPDLVKELALATVQGKMASKTIQTWKDFYNKAKEHFAPPPAKSASKSTKK